MPFQQLFPISDDHPRPPGGLNRDAALRFLRDNDVRYLRLQSSDIFGAAKVVEVPASRFERALDGGVIFDGSAVGGQAGGEETDMFLVPDPASLQLLPWGGREDRTAVLFCDVHRADGTSFEGDPRAALRRVLDQLASEGFSARTGTQIEFHLFERDVAESARTDDRCGYYDLPPMNRGEIARRDILNVAGALGIQVGDAHHELGPGQHEVSLAATDPLSAADQVQLFRYVASTVAGRHGLRASFMPKPRYGSNGSGMHVSQALFRNGANAFYDPEQPHELSEVLRAFVGGQLAHARGYCAVTNPLVNSYKRLVPGFGAPTHVVWALHNRSPLVRVPVLREESTSCEIRLPDPAANPYLTIALQLAAGLDGIRRELDPGEPLNKNVHTMSARERGRLKIPDLPRDLGEALAELEVDRVVRAALGEHIFHFFVEAKRAEWDEYRTQVFEWERTRYL